MVLEYEQIFFILIYKFDFLNIIWEETVVVSKIM